MRRLQIRLDDATHRALEARATASRRPLAAIVREAIAAYLRQPGPRRRALEEFTFIRSGRSGGPGDIARNHDKYLAEDFLA